MLVNEILKEAKENKVLVFFDMDGVCAEYKLSKKEILENAPDYYLKSRPIKTVIKVMDRLSKHENIEVGILSNCYYKEQKEDKIMWLKKYLPFLKEENINIVVLNDESFKPEDKDFIKAEYLNMIVKNKENKVYLIEDNHEIIKATNKALSWAKAEHVSRIIS